jgi:hypothetical protein
MFSSLFEPTANATALKRVLARFSQYGIYHGVRLPANAVIPAASGPNGYPYAMQMPPHEVMSDT